MKICSYCDTEVIEYKGYYWCHNCEEYYTEYQITETEEKDE